MVKLPPRLLEKYVLKRTGVRDPDLLVGPSLGEDSAVIDIGDGRVLVVHSDPITGAIEHLGWLAVHVASNDVAVTGAKPRWLLGVFYLPEGTGEEVLDKLTRQVDEAAREVGACVVGGHSEYTPDLKRPLVAMTAIGIAEKEAYVTTGGAREGDVVIMTKTAGIEGTSILASDFEDLLLEKGVSRSLLKEAKELVKRISVVREALLLAGARLVRSMHDPTEGGILCGLAEVAYASRKTLEVEEGKIPILPETREICSALGVDPLRLISSGTLLASVPGERLGDALGLLGKEGIPATPIGKVRAYEGAWVLLRKKDGNVERIEEVSLEDELFRLWSEHGG